MGTIIQTTCYLSWNKKNNQHNIESAQLGTGKFHSRTNKETSDSSSANNKGVDFAKYEELRGLFGRRATDNCSFWWGVISFICSFGICRRRIGGGETSSSGRADSLNLIKMTGWRTYQRPDDKSGGHGIGWSPNFPCAFLEPQDWDEVPMSIADLGGTEIDLRFTSPKE